MNFVLVVSLLVAAVFVIGPVWWLSWWATANAFDRHLTTGRIPSPGRDRQPSHEAWPHPVDLRVAPMKGAVGIRRLHDMKLVSSCTGADGSGRCPHPLADGSVPCAGHILCAPAAIRGSREWHIPQGYASCLLGSYNMTAYLAQR